MKRLALIALFLGACGGNSSGGGGGGDDGDDNPPPPPDTHDPLDYVTPAAGGKLRLVKNKDASTQTSVALDLVVGDQLLVGYSTGLNLPLAPGLATFAGFTPGTALDPGSDPVAAMAMVPTAGPLAGMLVVGLSQKAAGTGAIATDTRLEPGAVLLSVKFDLVAGAAPGSAVFDGTAAGFALPSGGLRDRAGLTVVGPQEVAIGKLEVNPPN